jgi:hypothetical protein
MTNELSERPYRIYPSNDPAGLRKINEQNKEFWSNQSELTVQRMSDPTLYALAMHDMRSEAIRVSIREQKSLDQALADAEQARDSLWKNPAAAERERRRSLSLKGGRAFKTDALQVLIDTCVRKAPNMSQRELWHQLRKPLGLGVIKAIDNQKIEFLDRDGKLKTSPVSGLKDRLSRAKSRIDSR